MIRLIKKNSGLLALFPFLFLLAAAILPFYQHGVFKLPSVNWSCTFETKQPYSLEIDWPSVFNTWKEWQTLISGMIALLSAFIGLWIAQFQAEEDRKKNLAADKAFLAKSFEELSTYCSQIIKCYNTYLTRNERCGVKEIVLPLEYTKTFRSCLRFADPINDEKLIKLLTTILYKMQVHTSRFRSFISEEPKPAPDSEEPKPDLDPAMGNLISLAATKHLILDNFPYARGEGPIKQAKYEKPDCWDFLFHPSDEAGEGLDRFEGKTKNIFREKLEIYLMLHSSSQKDACSFLKKWWQKWKRRFN